MPTNLAFLLALAFIAPNEVLAIPITTTTTPTTITTGQQGTIVPFFIDRISIDGQGQVSWPVSGTVTVTITKGFAYPTITQVLVSNGTTFDDITIQLSQCDGKGPCNPGEELPWEGYFKSSESLPPGTTRVVWDITGKSRNLFSEDPWQLFTLTIERTYEVRYVFQVYLPTVRNSK